MGGEPGMAFQTWPYSPRCPASTSVASTSAMTRTPRITGKTPFSTTWLTACDLVEALLYVRQEDEDVAYVRDPELLPDVYAHLVVVGAVVRRGTPDTLQPEARTRTEARPDVQRRPSRYFVVTDLAHVLHVREAHERAHPRGVRQLRPHEGGDGPVPDGLGDGQPDLQRPFDLRVRPGRRDGGLALPGLVALETLQRLFVRRSRPPR